MRLSTDHVRARLVVFRGLLGLLLAVCVALPLHAQDHVTRDASRACAGLRTLTLPGARITEAVAAEPDTVTREWPGRMTVRYCRVKGVIGRYVEFAAALPDDWNGRLHMAGNGGFAGYLAPLVAANAGYLAITTNTGHDANAVDGRWALNDPERRIDYGYRAVHETAEVGKALARAYYGAAPRYSYFQGCSNGGRQALMEAQRFPDDFDGIIAGAPAFDFTGIAAAFVRNTQAAFPAPARLAENLVTADNLKLVSAKVLQACDAIDGVTDGVIDDPRKCHFDLSSVRACAGDAAGADCLTSAQRRAIATIYSPVRVGGRIVYPGQPFGDEADPGGWADWITGARAPSGRVSPPAQALFAMGIYRYFVLGDSSWDYARYDLSRSSRDTRAAGAYLNAVDPDLSAFAAHRGKLLMYHGWADPALNPLSTIDYYRRVVARDPRAAAYLRLYMLPGVLHCAGGTGPDDVPFAPALRDWVERGRAPGTLVGTKHDAHGAIARTRPICPYPRHEVYTGHGSTDSASSFVCRA